jgi:hypothetical protein
MWLLFSLAAIAAVATWVLASYVMLAARTLSADIKKLHRAMAAFAEDIMERLPANPVAEAAYLEEIRDLFCNANLQDQSATTAILDRLKEIQTEVWRLNPDRV